MAAKKKTIAKTSKVSTAKSALLHKKVVLHHRLEKPVHNLVGYTILLVLAVITLIIIFSIPQNV